MKAKFKIGDTITESYQPADTATVAEVHNHLGSYYYKVRFFENGIARTSGFLPEFRLALYNHQLTLL
jgi:hypothetical protein